MSVGMSANPEIRGTCDDAVQLLLQYGAEIGKRDRLKRTSLHLAAGTGALGCLEKLLAALMAQRFAAAEAALVRAAEDEAYTKVGGEVDRETETEAGEEGEKSERKKSEVSKRKEFTEGVFNFIFSFKSFSYLLLIQLFFLSSSHSTPFLIFFLFNSFSYLLIQFFFLISSHSTLFLVSLFMQRSLVV
tara:strand:+ start:366 stop:929 length:564 start_codon:yes stop_codon:yes gene_type:complete